MDIERYAVYFAPPAGEFAARANHWLGRDPLSGQDLPQPDLGLDAARITTEPRRYGFHATLKAPFRLAPGQSPQALHDRVTALAAGLRPVTLPGLVLADLHGFLALRPEGDTDALNRLAADLVTGLEDLRAPLTPADRARRRPESLSPRQRDLLDQYGYPFVLEEFRFHMTLTDRLEPGARETAFARLKAHFAPVLPRPFRLHEICLFGQARDTGLFHELHRYPLSD